MGSQGIMQTRDFREKIRGKADGGEDGNQAEAMV